MTALPHCPKCQSEYTYEDGEIYICPECSHEWSKNIEIAENSTIIKDSNAPPPSRWRYMNVIKDLKVKSSSLVLKVGTKVKNIRLLTNTSDGHDIDSKIDDIGSMKLKSEFVKKV